MIYIVLVGVVLWSCTPPAVVSDTSMYSGPPSSWESSPGFLPCLVFAICNNNWNQLKYLLLFVAAYLSVSVMSILSYFTRVLNAELLKYFVTNFLKLDLDLSRSVV